ncbi:hypothetical protein FRB94_000460 [Tulasnella sp. JGI-2019a]|nr:hypothetical protein FRB94_000460 [Tulasnella sp. JGI-2019a]
MADSEKRAAVLAALREKKKISSTLSAGVSNSSSSGAASKDRVTSRHFPSSTASATTSSKYKPHQGHGVPLLKPTVAAVKPWNQRDDDHLVSSGFATSSHPSSSSVSSVSSAGRLLVVQPRRRTSVNDGGDERPRKRVNTGPPAEILVPASSPPAASSSKLVSPVRPAPSQTTSFDDSSPGVVRIRRKLGGTKLASSLPASDDDDDDESLPDLDVASRPKRRLVRGRQTESDDDSSMPIVIPSSPTRPPAVKADKKDAVARLHKLYHTVPPAYIAEVIAETGNVEKASIRLTREVAEAYRIQSSQPTASSSSRPIIDMPVPNARPPKKMVIPPSPVSPAMQGSQFSRANLKSAIYANRRNVGPSATGAHQLSSSRTLTSKTTTSIKDNDKARARAAQSDGDDAMELDSDSSDRGGKAKRKSEWDDASSEEEDDEDEIQRLKLQSEGVDFFNDATSEQLIEVTSCTPAQAASILAVRPFDDHDDLRAKFQKRKGISYKLFELYLSVMDGYSSLDKLLVRCESIGMSIAHVVNKWSGVDILPPSKAVTREQSVVDVDVEPSSSSASKPVAVEDTGIHLTEVRPIDDADPDLKDYIRSQPALINASVQLKDYQMLGINWLNLLWSRENSAILADEMGLGKTIQVIAFLAHLKETYPNNSYRHLIVVPPSTLENWVREFQRFAPDIDVRTYYGSQNDRVELRYELASSDEWDVVLTTYNFAAGNEHDRKFFKKTEWEVCVFDEGHMLKNFQSQRYEALMRIRAKWRLLLTGTPLQNNLQELVSLLNFIMPKLFIKHEESLRAIFKTKADSSLSFLSRERVSRAKKMMTPFVLRRRKDQVLKDLPQKKERIEYCYMTPLQRTIYREALKRSRKTIQALGEDGQPLEAEPAKPKRTQKSKTGKVMTGDTSSNVLMDLRKAASHPMLFRRLFPSDKIRQMAKSCMKEPEFCESNYQYVIEDMEVMTDAELQFFCKRYKSVNKFALDDKCYLDAGKISVLLKLLEGYKAEDKRVLVFSQFTQVLDIIKAIFAHKGIKYLVLTGTTAVDERQGLVDEFNEDETIPVFLLSTKAGGMGINLTAACVVIIFDQDFNPHNDKQAMDRCYRIGQKRDVEVIKLLTKDTIEEDIHRIGKTKLELDDAVAGGQEDDGEKAEKIMKSSLLTALRTKLEKEEEGGDGEGNVGTKDEDDAKTLGGPSTAVSTSDDSATIPIVVDDEAGGANGPHKPQKNASTVEVF